jgi:S-(hydroxymethyl)glutathione dehydrogenase/alcohol dehydrogenase
MAKAAILSGLEQPLAVREIELEAPHAGEVKVRLAASGVCHSDLSVQNGTIPLPTPIVLGHEGAGVVEEVGEGVTSVKPGDHVVLSYVPQCGSCYSCQRGQGFMCEKAGAAVTGGMLDGTSRVKDSDGSNLFVMAHLGTFSEISIVPEISVVKIDNDVPLKLASLLGCGVQTGVGAALNTADIKEGDTVAIIGCGGVGLNAIQGARIAGASEIIAVDQNETKLQMAKEFGATTGINAKEKDPVSAIFDLTGDRAGVDVAFEVIGLQQTIEQAMQITRRGGETILVGVPRLDVNLSINPAFQLVYTGKTIKGCWYGSSNVQQSVPMLLDLWKKGELKLEELISRTIGVDDINEAFEAMKGGEVARSVIEY